MRVGRACCCRRAFLRRLCERKRGTKASPAPRWLGCVLGSSHGLATAVVHPLLATALGQKFTELGDVCGAWRRPELSLELGGEAVGCCKLHRKLHPPVSESVNQKSADNVPRSDRQGNGGACPRATGTMPQSGSAEIYRQHARQHPANGLEATSQVNGFGCWKLAG